MTFGLSENAVKQFNDLYCLHDETIKDAFERVAKEFATNKEEEKLAYDLLAENIWRPNTPVWLNAGTDHKIFSACFVVSLEDSMDSIYDIANVARKIFQFGSGVGIPIGNLREAEAYIYEGHPEMIPEGKTSGPLTFAKLYDAVGETTKSGGRVRRAAILLLMLCWHPDITDFIKCKQIDGQLSNMNISVAITDNFMQCLNDKVSFNLLTPYDGSKVGEIDPQELWDLLSTNAHAHAEPGVIFIDTVNKWNPLIKKILIECCNPCLVGDTLVYTDRGMIKINEISLDDKVFTFNIKNNEMELEDISFVGKTRSNVDVIELELEDGEFLRLTPDHKVFTENRGYVKASGLNEKDIILTIE